MKGSKLLHACLCKGPISQTHIWPCRLLKALLCHFFKKKNVFKKANTPPPNCRYDKNVIHSKTLKVQPSKQSNLHAAANCQQWVSLKFKIKKINLSMRKKTLVCPVNLLKKAAMIISVPVAQRQPEELLWQR